MPVDRPEQPGKNRTSSQLPQIIKPKMNFGQQRKSIRSAAARQDSAEINVSERVAESEASEVQTVFVES